MTSNLLQADAGLERATHAVDIVAFVEANELAHHHVETPYRLVPAPGGEHLYSLLRDTLARTGRIAIAYVEIQAHQHLAALVPQGAVLMLNTLRWISEPPFAAHNTLAPENADKLSDGDVELAWLTQEALGFGPPDEDEADMFEADIVRPDLPTADDDEIDQALAYMLRPHPRQPAHARASRARPGYGRTGARARSRSRLLS